MRASTALRFVPPLALMGLIFYLSDQPDLSTGLGTWDLILRKIAHVGAFGLLALLWWRALLRVSSRHAMAAAALISLLFAASDEYHQTFVAGRHGSPVDVAIDALGIALAALLVRRLEARHRGGSMAGDEEGPA